MMVAILITLFLMGGMMMMVIGMKSSFGNQNQLSNLQEDQRFLLAVLNTTIHNAGFFPDPTSNTLMTALPVTSVANPDGTTFLAGQFVSGGTANGADTLNLRFMSASSDGLLSCLGDRNTSATPVIWTNSFTVNNANQLTCAVGVNGAAAGPASVLTDNIASMAVTYGVDTRGASSTDTYMTAAAVTAGNYWPAVYSVQVVLTFRDPLNSTPTAPVNLPRTLRHTFFLMNKP